jgi:polyketide cyclase/dehydrase/lipid transport protein
VAKFSFVLDSSVPPEQFLAALVDFSDSRIETWPTIDPKVFRVHTTSGTTAEVTEGSALFGGLWGRERYDWSTPGVVKLTLLESNVGRPGGFWEYRISPAAGGGSHIQMAYDRKSKGLKGRFLGALLQVTAGKPFLQNLQKTLDILASTRTQRPVH